MSRAASGAWPRRARRAGIEDWSGDPQRGFYDFEHAVARIEAAVEAAAALDTPFAITGRTECLLYAHEGGLDETARRLQGFAGVGAHCLYAPGTWDLEAISAVVADAGGPVNILALLGAPGLTLEELGEAGVRRVSLGSSLFTAQVAFARDQVAGRIHGSNASGESHRNRRALTLHNDDFRRWSRMPTLHTRIAHTGPSATSPCSVAPRGSQARDRTYIHA